jgi:hypothetical protein
MNTQSKRQSTMPAAVRPSEPVAVPARREYAERDFGVGYGRSSGYAATRRYVRAWNGQPHFRCV